MKVLVTGGTGVVGWALLSRCPPSTELAYTYYQNGVLHPIASGYQLDVRSESSVEELVSDLDPDAVVHSAAMTDVDDCERNPAAARAVNVEGTKNVVAAAAQVDAHLVFLSTSFVFDGTKQPHERDDSRSPVNVYGETKANAERVIESSTTPSAIVRTDQPYGWTESWQTATMIEWTLQQLAESNSVAVFEDWYSVPIFIFDLVKAVLNITLLQKTGIYHAVGPEYISRYEWACKIADSFGYDRSAITPASSENTPLPASRPNVHLDPAPAGNSAMANFKSIQDSLEQMVATRP